MTETNVDFIAAAFGLGACLYLGYFAWLLAQHKKLQGLTRFAAVAGDQPHER